MQPHRYAHPQAAEIGGLELDAEKAEQRCGSRGRSGSRTRRRARGPERSAAAGGQGDGRAGGDARGRRHREQEQTTGRISLARATAARGGGRRARSAARCRARRGGATRGGVVGALTASGGEASRGAVLACAGGGGRSKGELGEGGAQGGARGGRRQRRASGTRARARTRGTASPGVGEKSELRGGRGCSRKTKRGGGVWKMAGGGGGNERWPGEAGWLARVWLAGWGGPDLGRRLGLPGPGRLGACLPLFFIL
jgi:hypothetical protein